MAKEYYFLSDLHLGGDGELEHCDFAEEFVAFLKELAAKDADTELIIGGDLFGFWELTRVQGLAKLDEIVSHHGAIFEQFRLTGARIRITVMVGNHDYDLACIPEFAGRLASWNLHLDTAISLKRQMLGKTIWIEHGQQVDPFNASPDYGNRYALPVGYFITETIVAGASRYSSFGHGNWLKDIRSVGTERIPDWILSNYFYREMGFLIRAVLTVFLLLLTVTLLALAAQALEEAGIFDVNILLNNRLMNSLGYVGDIISAVIWINMLILFFMLIVAVPGFFVLRDLMNTLRRFRLTSFGIGKLEGENDTVYLNRARQVFAENPDAAVYLFGHTHRGFLIEENGRVIANMGTWLKILNRVPVRFGYLPAVYYPSFRLGYFRISAEGSRLVINHVAIDKTPARELDLLQRFLTLGRAHAFPRPIPATTAIETAPEPPAKP
ncbi:MAG: metallophosphoesterase [Bauldia sp.]